MRYDNDNDSRLPDVLRNGDGSEVLRRLSADLSRDEMMPRKIDLGDRDPFGLIEIPDTYEPMAEDLLTACEGITRVCADANKDTKKAFLASDSLTLPVVQISKRHSYQLRRRTDGDSIVYTYQRCGKGYEQAGFQIIRNAAGHTVLKTLNPEDTPVDEDEEYLKLIVTARRYINEYAKGLSIPIDTLEQNAQREITKDTVRRKIGHGVLHSAGVMAVALRKGLRPLPYVFAAGLVLAPWPGYSTPLYKGSPLDKPFLVELGDDVFNHDDHKRQGLDARGVHLPDSAQVVNNGETRRLAASTLTPLLLKQLDGAPEMNADYESTHDLYGGPRHLSYLGRFSDNNGDEDPEDLDPAECEDLKVNMDPEDGLKVMGVDATTDQMLEMTVSNDEIVICNLSDKAIHERKMQNIYVEVVNR